MAELYVPSLQRDATSTTSDERYEGKFIEKEVTQFIREECGKLPQLSRVMNADLKSIATNSSAPDILKVRCLDWIIGYRKEICDN
jgi:hypothetical protein